MLEGKTQTTLHPLLKRCTDVTNANTIIQAHVQTDNADLDSYSFIHVAAHCNNSNITIHCTANFYFDLSTHKVAPPMGRKMPTQQLVFLQPAKRHCAGAQVISTGTYPLTANVQQQSWDRPS